MLTRLTVSNYILIRDLEIEFGEGFAVITGETGAGKSILLGALALILGQRADTGSLLDQDRKCVIEGHFRVAGYKLETFFESRDLDYEETITLRREISPQGKSRAFINDTPVNLAVMKELGDRLVNIHSQHSIVTLNDSGFQLSVIDSFAGIHGEIDAYRLDYRALAQLRRELAAAEDREARLAGERDYRTFLLEELESAKLLPGEFEELNTTITLLEHAGEIKDSVAGAHELFTGDDRSILGSLSDAIQLLSHVTRYSPNLQEVIDRIRTNYIDLKDIAGELAVADDQLSADPERLETMRQRRELLTRLMRKHGAGDLAELIGIREGLSAHSAEGEDLKESIVRLKKGIDAADTALRQAAGNISARRKKAVPAFEKQITGMLTGLGIPMARFVVDIKPEPLPGPDGADRVTFLFSANAGVVPGELSEVASGGELSRLMLAVKAMIGQKNLLPTIIFDEIDNGVSGEVAGKVGTILRTTGSTMQVIAITHLPQIAARGSRHYRVFKTESEQSAMTSITELHGKERVGEIARMLSSEVVTPSAIKTATELLNN